MSCKTKAIVSVLVLFAVAPVAFGAIAAVGPLNPNGSGFPLWVQDATGLALDLNTDPLLGISAPVIVGNAQSVLSGFGDEGFYFDATAVGTTAQGGNITYVAAIEAAYVNGPPVAGEQIVFGRIRIRVDTPQAGTYTVTHPYGVNTFNVAAAGVRSINFTSDIIGAPPAFAGMQTTPVGPFVKALAPAPPAGFIGNPAIDQTVTGSPRGTNFVRVVGPGVNVTLTNFSVAGRIFTAVPPALPPGAPLTNSAAIIRTPFVDIATVAPIGSTVTATLPATPAAGFGKPASAAQKVAMVGDGAGNFFVRLHTPSIRNLPANVIIDATPPAPALPSTGTIPLTDAVQILSATYNVNAKTLVVVAVSSDRSKPFSLTATGFGPFTNHTLIRRAVASPVAEITVVSANGGTATAPVNIVGFVRPTAVP